MAELFQCFPHLMSERLIIRKMIEYDIDSLSEITNNENEYRYISLFLYKKSRGVNWKIKFQSIHPKTGT